MPPKIGVSDGCDYSIEHEHEMSEDSNVQLTSIVKNFFGVNKPLYIVGNHYGEVYCIIPHHKYQIKKLKVSKKRKLSLSTSILVADGTNIDSKCKQLVLAYCTETIIPITNTHVYHLYVHYFNWNEFEAKFECFAKYKKIELINTAVMHMFNSNFIGLNLVLSYTNNSLELYTKESIESFNIQYFSPEQPSKMSTCSKNIFSKFYSSDVIISIDSIDCSYLKCQGNGCHIFCATVTDIIYGFLITNSNNNHTNDENQPSNGLEWTVQTKIYNSIYHLACFSEWGIALVGIYDCLLVEKCKIEQFFSSDAFNASRVPFIDEHDQVISISMNSNYLFVGTYNGSIAIYHLCDNEHIHLLAKTQIRQNIIAIWGRYDEEVILNNSIPKIFSVSVVVNNRILIMKIFLKTPLSKIT